MKNKELYDKTISILVKAYLNDTLVHGNCQACAVGNLVAGNLGYQYTKDDEYKDGCGRVRWSHENHHNVNVQWYNVLGTYSRRPFFKMEKYFGKSKEQIDATGYAPEELLKIENSFEKHTNYKDEINAMYNGLMAVVEVLGQIHEVEKEITEETKLMFTK